MVGPEPSDEFGRERPGSAPNVDHALAAAHARQVGQLGRQPTGISAHEAVIGLGGDLKAHDGTVPRRPDEPVVPVGWSRLVDRSGSPK